MLWLQLARGGCGTVAVLLLGKGIDFSTEGQSHELVTYFGFYGGSVLFALATVWLSLVLHENKREAAAAEPRTEERRRSAKRGARHTHTELSTTYKKLDDALQSGFWWNVTMEGLQMGEWQAAKDSLADDAPPVYDALAPVYARIEDMNAKANNHFQGGHDDFSEKTAGEIRSLRSRISTAQRKLRDYYES